MHQIFLSYSKKQKKEAKKLVNLINKLHKVKVWDFSGLTAGHQWRKEIDESIKRSSLVILLVSKDSINSKYVTYEWAYALGIGIKVLPIKLEDRKLHPRLEVVQHLDINDKEFKTKLKSHLSSLSYPEGINARYDDSLSQIDSLFRETEFKANIRFAIDDVWGFRPQSKYFLTEDASIIKSNILGDYITRDIIDFIVDTGQDEMIAVKSYYCRQAELSEYDAYEIIDYFEKIKLDDNFKCFLLITNTEISKKVSNILKKAEHPISYLHNGVTTGFLITGLSYVKDAINGKIVSIDEDDGFFRDRIFVSIFKGTMENLNLTERD